MKAEYISFNGDYHKDCSRCGTKYGSTNGLQGLSEFFPKDKRKSDGFAYTCKRCKAGERKTKVKEELARWKKYYAPGTEARKRHIIRSQTRKKFGSAKLQICQNCNLMANEWHHIEYKIDTVIALCEKCHTNI